MDDHTVAYSRRALCICADVQGVVHENVADRSNELSNTCVQALQIPDGQALVICFENQVVQVDTIGHSQRLYSSQNCSVALP